MRKQRQPKKEINPLEQLRKEIDAAFVKALNEAVMNNVFGIKPINKPKKP